MRALPFFSALCCFPVDIVALGKVGRCLCIYVCTDFSTRPFQFWTCVACMWVFFYTNHNLVDEWHMFGNLDKYGNLPDCHQWTHIYHWWCRAGAKLVMCAYFSELETYVYNASLLRVRWGAVCFPIVSLHNSKIGSRVDITSLLGRGVTPSGNLKIDPISGDHPPASCCFSTAQITSGSGMT